MVKTQQDCRRSTRLLDVRMSILCANKHAYHVISKALGWPLRSEAHDGDANQNSHLDEEIEPADEHCCTSKHRGYGTFGQMYVCMLYGWMDGCMHVSNM